jgi:hypothetical protein
MVDDDIALDGMSSEGVEVTCFDYVRSTFYIVILIFGSLFIFFT